MTEPAAVLGFMNPKLSSLRDPQKLPGCGSTARKILDAIREKRRIVVYGDYDVDGMTGTAILRQAIKLLGGDVGYYVPNRLDEGYGLNEDALKNLAEDGAKVVLTVDCGISSCAEALAAKNLGLELLITDHHTPGATLPEAAAIAHPQLLELDGRYYSPHSPELPADSQGLVRYPFPELSGATVALKVAWALGQLASGEQKVSPKYRDFLLQAVGLAAMGTVADVMPLIDENRVLVRYGLETSLIRHAPIGIGELCKTLGSKAAQKLSSETIGFQMAPRLNAAGRLGQAQLGVELLITDDENRAREIAEYINGLNESRQKLERGIFKEATRQIEELYESDDPAYVLASADWHSGVIGIVAGRLAEQYHRPVIMISQDKMGLKPGTGSGRAIPGFNLYDALDSCGEHLVRFGGHASAVGLGVADAAIPAFRAAFCEAAAAGISEDMKSAELLIDAEFPFGALTAKTVGQIEEMAPFGSANPRPILCTTGVSLSGEPKTMGADNRHFNAGFRQDGITLRAVAFGTAAWVEQMRAYGNGPFDLAYHVVINSYKGRHNVELQLLDWRPSGDSPSKVMK